MIRATALALLMASAILALFMASTPAAARELTYGCACVGKSTNPDCTGGSGIAGAHGSVRRDIPAGQVAPFYPPSASEGIGGSGWACLAEGSYACVCNGAPDRPGCGNTAVAGSRGEIRIALTLTDVLKNYGPGRIDRERTGWACVLTDIWTP